MSTISVRLPESLHDKVRDMAEQEKVSINQFITVALEEKLSALMTERYLDERAGRGNRTKLLDALSKVPDVEPEGHDQL